MERVLAGLQPEKVFYYFEEITKIPHESKNEKQLSDFLLNLAKNKAWNVEQDKALNIIIRKPATKGYENAPTIMLQGHMDMVCEKNEDVKHDFKKDPLKLRIVDGQIYATGTTLGADNGIAVAMILALFDSEDAKHPAIEAVITVDEEMSMSGVQKIDGSKITAKYVINIDSEVEGIITVSSAGGQELFFKFPVKKIKATLNNTCIIKVSGLSGGHSGISIDKEKGNSNKILGKILYDLMNEIEIVSINGGSKSNAIPREAKAIVKTNDVNALAKKIEDWNKIIRNEYLNTEPDVKITIESSVDTNEVLDKVLSESIIACINLIPSGVLSKSTDIDLVIFSNNLGVVTTNDDFVMLHCHPRSSVMSMILKGFEPSMRQLAKYVGAEFIIEDYYPGWEYAKESKIRDICIKAYKESIGKDCKIEAIHAGLEVGYLFEKCKSLVDAVSIGPNMEDVHSPNEHVDIKSIERTYKYLCNILEKIK